MLFAIKCSKHYPGYEVAHAPTLELLKSQIDGWRTCQCDMVSITELPEGDIPEELTKKLAAWTEEFQKTH